MKYIVTVNHDQKGKEEIIIFSNSIIHKCMAEVVKRIKNSGGIGWEREDREVIAAGFTDGMACWGRSESLDLDSRGALDAKLISRGER